MAVPATNDYPRVRARPRESINAYIRVSENLSSLSKVDVAVNLTAATFSADFEIEIKKCDEYEVGNGYLCYQKDSLSQ